MKRFLKVTNESNGVFFVALDKVVKIRSDTSNSEHTVLTTINGDREDIPYPLSKVMEDIATLETQ
jgi:hypothetical protein